MFIKKIIIILFFVILNSCSNFSNENFVDSIIQQYPRAQINSISSDFIPPDTDYAKCVEVINSKNRLVACFRNGEFDSPDYYVQDEMIVQVKGKHPVKIGYQLKINGEVWEAVEQNSTKTAYLFKLKDNRSRPQPISKLSISLRKEIWLVNVDYNFKLKLATYNQYGMTTDVQQWQMDRIEDRDIDGLAALATYKDWRGAKSPVIVAVLDTGITKDHPALNHSIWKNDKEIPDNKIDDDNNGYIDDVYGWNFLENNKHIFDDQGHGTHVSGIISAKPTVNSKMQGLNPEAKIATFKIANSKGDFASEWDVGKAIEYSVSIGCKVINMSFTFPQYNSYLDNLTRSLYSKASMVAAAGNDGKSYANSFPAAYWAVTAVASSNIKDELSIFSNFDPEPYSGRATLQLAAPGEDIYSTFPTGYRKMSGTSMAAPHVAAAMSILHSIYPNETTTQIRMRLINSADHVDAITKIYQGRRLNAYKAMYEAPEQLASDGVTPFRNENVNGQLRKNRWPYANFGDPGVDGSSIEKAYAICSVQQLMNIRPQDMAKHFKLMNNIDCKELYNKEFKMIGSPGNVFHGTFNGNGYTIKNFKYKDKLNHALFYELGPNSAVFNLSFSNVNINNKGDTATIAIKSSGVINFVHVEGKIAGESSVGGLVVRQTGGKIRNCLFEGVVKGGSFVGGIVGQGITNMDISRTLVQGEIKGSFKVGGIAGSSGRKSVIESCVAVVNIPSTGQAIGETIGGITGYAGCYTQVKNCTVQGNLAGIDKTGGIVGHLENAHIHDSYSIAYQFYSQKSNGGVAGFKLDNIVRGIGGDPPPYKYVCTGTLTPAPDSSVNRSYYDSQFNKPGVGGYGKSRWELKQKSTFKGWSFGSHWWIPQEYSPILVGVPRSRGTYRPAFPEKLNDRELIKE